MICGREVEETVSRQIAQKMHVHIKNRIIIEHGVVFWTLKHLNSEVVSSFEGGTGEYWDKLSDISYLGTDKMEYGPNVSLYCAKLRRLLHETNVAQNVRITKYTSEMYNELHQTLTVRSINISYIRIYQKENLEPNCRSAASVNLNLQVGDHRVVSSISASDLCRNPQNLFY